MGVDLELATSRTALASARDVPDTMAVAVNLSPAALLDPRLLACLDELADPHPLIAEIAEHEPIADYALRDGVLVELRRRGIRIAIDDAGVGCTRTPCGRDGGPGAPRVRRRAGPSAQRPAAAAELDLRAAVEGSEVAPL